MFKMWRNTTDLRNIIDLFSYVAAGRIFYIQMFEESEDSGNPVRPAGSDVKRPPEFFKHPVNCFLDAEFSVASKVQGKQHLDSETESVLGYFTKLLFFNSMPNLHRVSTLKDSDSPLSLKPHKSWSKLLLSFIKENIVFHVKSV